MRQLMLIPFGIKQHTLLCQQQRLFLAISLLFFSSLLQAQEAPQERVYSPNGIFDRIYTDKGEQYSLDELRIDHTLKTNRSEGSGCQNTGYFVLHYEVGSGLEDFSNPEHLARRNVLCQLFSDLSAFIIPVDPSNEVHIRLINFNDANTDNGVLAFANAFYSGPQLPAPNGGLNDCMIWKTINSGVNGYSGLVTSSTLANQNSGFYHAQMAFNFSYAWHTDLYNLASPGHYDMYTVSLHEIMHALGFVSQINDSGQSKLGENFPFYSRYDSHLKSPPGTSLITPNDNCSMYNYIWNSLLFIPGDIVSPGSTTSGCNLDYTNCVEAVQYVSSFTQPVYSPNCYNAGSSLSHFEDQCMTNGDFNNQYFVMSNAGGTGIPGTKRHLQPEERTVLCDIGYTVASTYGVTGNPHFTYYDYGTGVCNENNQIAGIEDGLNPDGTYRWVINAGPQASVDILGSEILSNDHGYGNNISFKCLEVLSGPGILSAFQGNESTTINYMPASTTNGLCILRYLPVNGDKIGNITYIYIYVTNSHCAPSVCNMINNGGFEEATSACSYGYVTPVSCWSSFIGSPDHYGVGCTSIYAVIPGPCGGSATIYPWNNSTENNHLLSVIGQVQTNPTTQAVTFVYEEGIQSALSTPLINGNSYTLKMHLLQVSGPYYNNYDAHLVAGISSGPLSLSTGEVDFASNPITQIGSSFTVPATGQWDEYQLDFVYTGPTQANNFILFNDAQSSLGGGTSRILIDDIVLTINENTSLEIQPNSLCVGQSIVNLSLSANPSYGTFTGPGVQENNGIYSFNATADLTGTNEISYTYINDLGCSITLTDEIIVGNETEITLSSIPSADLCEGQSKTLYVENPIAGATYTWTPSTGLNTSVGSSVVASPNSTITYAVDLNINGCQSHNEINVSVHPVPFILDISTSRPCGGLCNGFVAVNYEYNGDANDLQFNWYLDGVFQSNYTTATITDACPGEYMCVISNPQGCSSNPSTVILPGSQFDQSVNVVITTQAEANAILINEHSYNCLITFAANPTPYVLSNLTLYMEGGGISISEGANVIFNHCTFTSCSNWRGFIIQSNGTTSISAGKLAFDPNGNSISIIEYAQEAINTHDNQINPANLLSLYLQAGYINCNRTIFRNNLISVNLYNARMQIPQAFPAFRRCTFTIDDEFTTHFPDLNGGEYDRFKQHVKLVRVFNYNFYGCTFKNEMSASTNLGQWKNRGIGINSSASRFSIDKLAGTQLGVTYGGTFIGFDKAIATGKGASTIRITGQTFRKNHIAIHLIGASGSRVYANTIKIAEITGVPYLDNQENYGVFPGNNSGITNDNALSYEGLVIHTGDIIEIAENTFTGYTNENGGVSNDLNRIGVRIRSTKTTNMVVNKNTFSSLNFAALANGDNSDGDATNGLRFLCNSFSNPSGTDITNADFVTNQLSNSDDLSRIALWQLVPGIGEQTTISAGNIFTQNGDLTIAAHQFHNEGPLVLRYEHNGVANQIPTYRWGIMFDGITIATQDNECTAQYSTPHVLTPSMILTELITKGLAYKINADNLRYLYLTLIDNGDSQALQTFVQNTWGIAVWNTREQLLEISPFVSNEVLIKVLDNTDVYPHSMAFELILANPTCMNSPSFIRHLSEKSDPMPEQLINFLLLFQGSQGSYRTELEQNLSIEKIKQHTPLNQAFWAMLEYENNEYNNAELLPVLEKLNSLNTEIFGIELLIEDDNWTDALTKLSSIPYSVLLNERTKAEFESYSAWTSLRQKISSENTEWDDLESDDFNELQKISLNFDSYAGAQAVQILNEFYNYDYFTPPALGKIGETRSMQEKCSPNSKALISLYPNPADYIITFSINELLTQKESSTLVVTNALGQKVHQVQIAKGQTTFSINTTSWVNGVYLYELHHPTLAHTLNGKFEVQH